VRNRHVGSTQLSYARTGLSYVFRKQGAESTVGSTQLSYAYGSVTSVRLLNWVVVYSASGIRYVQVLAEMYGTAESRFHTAALLHCRTVQHTAAHTATHTAAFVSCCTTPHCRTRPHYRTLQHCRTLLPHLRTAAHCRAHCHTLPFALPHIPTHTLPHYCNEVTVLRCISVN
jgi:hypothetical protein